MSDEEETVRQAMSIIGRKRTAKKKESGQENAAKARSARWADPAARERQAQAIREAARLRREAKQAEQAEKDGQSPTEATKSSVRVTGEA